MSLFGHEIVTFSKEHPGGGCNLSIAANSNNDEAKMLFLSYHTGKNMAKIKHVAKLKKFKDVSNIKESLLYKEINEIFIDVCSKHKIHGVIYKMYAAMIALLFVWCLIYNIFHSCLSNMLLLAFVWNSYAFTIFHTRHHLGGNLFIKNSYILRQYFDTFDNIFTIPAKHWLYNHELSHHLYPNSSMDYDVYNPYPFLRLIDDHKLYKYNYIHKYQWIYCIILFMVNGLTFPLKNIKLFDKHKTSNLNANDGHWIFSILYLFILIILPYYFNGFYAIKLYFMVYPFTSLFASLFFQISHHVMDINHHNDISNIKNYDDWIKSQIEESMSWGGYIATLILGGINFQIEHHMAPAILPIYYYFAKQQIQNLCKKYNMKYIYYGNFISAFYQYEKYLYHCSNNINDGI